MSADIPGVNDRSNVLTRATVLNTLEEMIEALYGFALKRTRNRPDAEDLTQAVAEEVLKSWRSVRSATAIQPWIWSIARHTHAKWIRTACRDRAVFTTEGIQASLLAASSDDTVEAVIGEQKIGELRREIALLSGCYRDAIVSYYLNGHSYNEIAEVLGVPLSTVKWRLHVARKILEEGLAAMREFGQLSYNPKKIDIGGYGNWNPGDCLGSLLRQNIFVAAYQQPVSITDLAVELGVASAFIEDEVSKMIKDEVLEYTPGNKVRTTFILHSTDADLDTRPIMAELEAMIAPILEAAPEKLHRNLIEQGLDLTLKEWNRLLPTVIPDMIYTACGRLERDITRYDHMPKHANGQVGWGTAWEVQRRSISRSTAHARGSRYGWVDQVIYWAGTYGWKKRLDISDQELICDVIFGVDGNRQPIVTSREAEERLSMLIASGHLVRDNAGFEPRFIIFTKEDKEKYDAALKPLLEPVKAAMEAAHESIVGKLLRRVPVHLHEQVPVFALCILTDLPSVIDKMVAKFDPEWPYGMRLVIEHGHSK